MHSSLFQINPFQVGLRAVLIAVMLFTSAAIPLPAQVQAASQQSCSAAIDPSYSSEFNFYSAERLFAPIGSNIVDVYFFNPADQTTPALVDSLGVIFTDVDRADVTKMEFYDVNDNVVHTLNVATVPGSESLSLAGVKFTEPCIRWVRITAGSIGLRAGINEAHNNVYNSIVVF